MTETSRDIVFMFGGQGTHYAGMGQDLYAQHPVFRDVMQRGDAVVRDLLRESIVDALYRHPRPAALDRLVFSQAVIVLIGCAMAATLRHEGITPRYAWGSSLGEFAAAEVAGVWSLERSLTAAIQLGSCVAEACAPGGITAVLAPAETFEQWPASRRSVTLAGVNTPNHFIVAAEAEAMDAFDHELRAAGVAYQRLPIAYAFHSPSLDAAKDAFLAKSAAWAPLERTSFDRTSCDRTSCDRARPGKVAATLVSSITGAPMDVVTPRHFWDAAREPIQFRRGVETLEARHPMLYVDCSASGTLATFVKHNLAASSASRALPVLTPFHRARHHLDRLHQLLW